MDVLSGIIVLFSIMVIGFYAGHKGIITPEVRKGLSELLLRITLPIMIVGSFNFEFSMDMLLNAGRILIYSIIIHLGCILISGLFYIKYPSEKKAVLRFITAFSNCGFMGYPIIGSIFGNEGIFYTSIYNIGFNSLIWTAGVMLFTDSRDKGSIRKVLLNPCILAVFFGILIYVCQAPIPQTVWTVLELAGGVTTPISMMIIGAMLSEMKFRDIVSGSELYYAAFIRLAAVPALVYIVFKIFGAEGMVPQICIIISGMPAAVNTAIISDKYGGDTSLASKCVFTTTALSAITIPVMLMLI